MKESVKVTVVTVCRNSEKTIEQTIKSVVDQSYGNIEYIIVDGASTDETMDIVRRYEEHIARYVSEPDKGIYDAMNKGIDMATGELIAFLNSDDWYELDAIKKIVEKYVETGADVIHGKIKLIEKDRTTLREIRGFCMDVRKLYLCMMLPHQACFTRTELMKEHHFETRYRIAADYKFMLQVLNEGRKFCYLDVVVANFCVGGVSSKEYRTFKEICGIAVDFLDGREDLNKIYGSELEKCCKYGIARFVLERMRRHCKDVGYLERTLSKPLSLYLFGTGDVAKKFVRVLEEIHVPIVAFFDNNKSKHGTVFMGRKILSPDQLDGLSGATIMIATDVYDTEIREQLSRMKLYQCKVYSVIEWIESAVSCYVKETFSLGENKHQADK